MTTKPLKVGADFSKNVGHMAPVPLCLSHSGSLKDCPTVLFYQPQWMQDNLSLTSQSFTPLSLTTTQPKNL